jgi:hypothetical protein
VHFFWDTLYVVVGPSIQIHMWHKRFLLRIHSAAYFTLMQFLLKCWLHVCICGLLSQCALVSVSLVTQITFIGLLPFTWNLMQQHQSSHRVSFSTCSYVWIFSFSGSFSCLCIASQISNHPKKHTKYVLNINITWLSPVTLGVHTLTHKSCSLQ